jgi:hypothetical protein
MFCWIRFKEWKQNKKKQKKQKNKQTKYQTVGIVPNSNRQIRERGNIDAPNTQIDDHAQIKINETISKYVKNVVFQMYYIQVQKQNKTDIVLFSSRTSILFF